VNPFLRLLPYFWPHRRKFYLSVVFAVLVALFWGITLSMTFLVVKVFLQGQTFGQYVDAEIEKLENEIEGRSNVLKQIDGKGMTRDEPTSSEKSFYNMRNQTKQGARLSSASQRLMVFTWVKKYVVRFLPNDPFDNYALILGALLVASLLKGVCMFFQETLIGSVVELTAMSVRNFSSGVDTLFKRSSSMAYICSIPNFNAAK